MYVPCVRVCVYIYIYILRIMVCADKLAFLGHSLTDTFWFDTMPPSLAVDFARDRSGLPNYRFPWTFLFIFLVSCFSSLEGIGLVPPICIYFFLFFNNITYQEGGKGWRSLLGANLVGMLQFPPDA